ncbi:MAG: sugar ABC transporter ATP-binding protein [Bacilli bacterium]
MAENLLELKNISKSFPGVKALDTVSFNIKKGTVHSLMGENGAGKSTLMKCIFGIYTKDEGEIIFEGKPFNAKNSLDALKRGVSMVHQELNLVNERNIMDNIWLGRYPGVGIFVNEKIMYQKTREVFEELNIDLDPKTKCGDLSVSQMQMVEIAKAVSYDSKLIVMDEPTSSLSEKEVSHLFDIINILKKRGCSIIYISHKMEEILQISDEVTIMRDGKHIETKHANDLTKEEIIKLMVGRELTSMFPEKTNVIEDVLLEVKNLTSDKFEDICFNLREGEILGIAGLVGARRTELVETIFGLRGHDSGKLILKGKEVKINNPQKAIASGIALVTEERRATGIFKDLSVSFNTIIANIDTYYNIFSPLGNYKKIKADVEWSIDSMKIKTPHSNTKIGNLSGGNQQKVILGKWLLTKPDVLLLDEPTRGIDVGAKYDIYSLILDLANNKKGCIVISSEMIELLGITDRIVVMSNGKVAGIVKTSETSQEEILELAAKYV